MPIIMRKVIVDRVDVVDRGSNPDAHIAIFKRNEEGSGNTTVNTVSTLPITLTDEQLDAFITKLNEHKEGVVKSMTFEEFVNSLTPEQQALVRGEITKKDSVIEELKKAAPGTEPTAEEFFKGWPKEAREEFEKMKKANDDAVILMKKMSEDSRKAVFIAKASAFKNISVDAPVFGEKMAKIAEVDSELAESIYKTLEAADVAAADLMGEYGVSLQGEGSNEAYDQLVSKAKEIQKSAPDMTEQQAFTKACEDNADMYIQYTKQLRGE